MSAAPHPTAETVSPPRAYTREMAAFIARFEYAQIPEEVRTRLKLLMLDSLGCGIYGFQFEWSRILFETLSKVDSGGPCLIWGSNRRMSAPHATLINGTLIQAFELDDIHTRGLLHVGCVVLPPLLALLESGHAMSGKDLLRAAACGYEIGPRVGLCMGQRHLTQGWHTAATIGVSASTAACASALRLSADQTVHALGIGATQSSGLMAAQFGSMVKRMHAGRAAQSGLYAALLAQAGFTGIDGVYEAPYGGFCTTFSASPDQFDLGQLTDGLGTRFETMNDAIKFYACAASNHSALDAIGIIRRRRPFEPEEIEQITVTGSEAMKKHVFWKYQPDSLTTAQFNMPFVLATYIVEGAAFIEQFDEASLTADRRLALADKVEFMIDAEATAAGARMRHKASVSIRFRNGEIQRETVAAQRGTPSRFPSEAEVVEKFMKLAAHVLPSGTAERLCDLIAGLEQLDDAREIAAVMASDRGIERK